MRIGFKLVAALGAVLVTGGMIIASVVVSEAQEEKPPIQIELLTGRAAFTDEVDLRLLNRLSGSPAQAINVKDPSRVVVARITIQPGFVFPWHTHPGPVIVSVVEGKLIYVNASDCVKRPYWANEVFIDPGQGNVHTAFNGYFDETVLIATFFQIGEDGPLTITDGIQPPDDCVVG